MKNKIKLVVDNKDKIEVASKPQVTDQNKKVITMTFQDLIDIVLDELYNQQHLKDFNHCEYEFNIPNNSILPENFTFTFSNAKAIGSNEK